jgi:hypothetical protein
MIGSYKNVTDVNKTDFVHNNIVHWASTYDTFLKLFLSFSSAKWKSEGEKISSPGSQVVMNVWNDD